MIFFRLDDDTPWPAQNSAGKELVERPGWRSNTLDVKIRGKWTTIQVKSFIFLAVNRMIESEGFTICLNRPGAYRLSHGGRVFAQCADAMKVAEFLESANSDWLLVPQCGYNRHQLELMKTLHDAAQRQGKILPELVFPI